MENEAKEFTSLHMTLANLQTIRRVLHSYTKEISSNAPPSPTRDKLLLTIETLCKRIADMKQPGELQTPHEFSLSSNEFTLVDSALRTYIASMGHSIPPSEERDEIMRGCEALRVHIMADRTRPLPSSP